MTLIAKFKRLGMLSRDHTVLPDTHASIHKSNEQYLPCFSSQSWSWFTDPAAMEGWVGHNLSSTAFWLFHGLISWDFNHPVFRRRLSEGYCYQIHRTINSCPHNEWVTRRDVCVGIRQSSIRTPQSVIQSWHTNRDGKRYTLRCPV